MGDTKSKKKIVTLVYQSSVIVKGIEKRLTEGGYEIESVVGSFDKAKELLQDTDLFIAYLPDDIAEDDSKLKKLHKLLEMIMEGGANLIVIGEKRTYSELISAAPEIRGFVWLDRPVDVSVLNDAVETALLKPDERGKKKRILIVDDDPSYAKIVREWIKDYYKVDIVTAGMQAISFLLKVPKEDKVDLIFLDYEMPIVDGPQVFQMLRQEEVTADIPVIFLTGVGTREGVSRVMELKPDGYILKSTTREDILGYLREKLFK